MTLFISCSVIKNQCIYKKKSKKDHLIKSFTAYNKWKKAWNQKKENEKKYGIIEDIFISNSIYFNQFCSNTKYLKPLHRVIGYLLDNKKSKLKIIGNSDNIELIKTPNISFDRIKFVFEILKKCGISENRIIIKDLKNELPMRENSKIGRFYNRRIDFKIIDFNTNL